MNREELEILVKEGFSSRKIAKKIGKSQCCVNYWLKKHELCTLKKQFNIKIPQCGCGESRPFFFYSNRCSKCKICHNQPRCTYQRKQRKKVLELYGNKCECCGESNFEFLSIDHIDGGGSIESAKLGGSYGIIRKLFKAGIKLDGYRILCHNCNQSIGHYGYCPHHNLRR